MTVYRFAIGAEFGGLGFCFRPEGSITGVHIKAHNALFDWYNTLDI